MDRYEPPPSYTGPIWAVILFIHGGAWHFGSQKSLQEAATCLSMKGFIVVTPTYRVARMQQSDLEPLFNVAELGLCWHALWAQRRRWIWILLWLLMLLWRVACLANNPACSTVQIDDIRQAFHQTMAWLQLRTDVVHRDGLILMGHSAGAHLATLLSHEVADQVYGVVAMGGVYSAARLQQTPVGSKVARSAFGMRFEHCFPIRKIHRTSPPHFLINARYEMDFLRHTWDYFFALRQAGVYVQTQVYSAHHFNIIQNWSNQRQNILNDIVKFCHEAITTKRQDHPAIVEHVVATFAPPNPS